MQMREHSQMWNEKNIRTFVLFRNYFIYLCVFLHIASLHTLALGGLQL